MAIPATPGAARVQTGTTVDVLSIWTEVIGVRVTVGYRARETRAAGPAFIAPRRHTKREAMADAVARRRFLKGTTS